MALRVLIGHHPCAVPGKAVTPLVDSEDPKLLPAIQFLFSSLTTLTQFFLLWFTSDLLYLDPKIGFSMRNYIPYCLSPSAIAHKSQ